MGDRKNASSRMGKISMRECLIWKSHVKKEINTAHQWAKKYGWMTDLYGDMEKKLNEMSKKSEFLKEVFTDKEEDNRDIRPVPESVNHLYGWIASKQEFQLKIQDRTKHLPLPPNYKLVIPYDSPYWCYLKS